MSGLRKTGGKYGFRDADRKRDRRMRSRLRSTKLLHGFIEACYVNNETLEAAADLAVVAEFSVEDLRHRFIDIRILTDDAGIRTT